MGRTLFQIMKDKIGPSQELRAETYNPLKLKVGQRVSIDVIDLREKDFKLAAVRENTRTDGGEKFQSMDYELAVPATTVGGKPEVLRLRVSPLAHPDPASGLTHSVVALSLYYECGYQAGVTNGMSEAVKADTGEFQIDWNGKRTYWRINDLRTSYNATVKVFQDLDGSGKIDANEVREVSVEYWDYWTELPNEAGGKFTEFLFVERSKDNGWWQIWRGSELDPSRVSVL